MLIAQHSLQAIVTSMIPHFGSGFETVMMTQLRKSRIDHEKTRTCTTYRKTENTYP